MAIVNDKYQGMILAATLATLAFLAGITGYEIALDSIKNPAEVVAERVEFYQKLGARTAGDLAQPRARAIDIDVIRRSEHEWSDFAEQYPDCPVLSIDVSWHKKILFYYATILRSVECGHGSVGNG